jgi:hypothetical protein
MGATEERLVQGESHTGAERGGEEVMWRAGEETGEGNRTSAGMGGS